MKQMPFKCAPPQNFKTAYICIIFHFRYNATMHLAYFKGASFENVLSDVKYAVQQGKNDYGYCNISRKCFESGRELLSGFTF